MNESTYAGGMRTIYYVYFERMTAFRLRHDSLSFRLIPRGQKKGLLFWFYWNSTDKLTDVRTMSHVIFQT